MLKFILKILLIFLQKYKKYIQGMNISKFLKTYLKENNLEGKVKFFKIIK
jgi:hypothetical protein